MRFPIVIHKDPQSDFSVLVPDLLGCYSAGSDIDEAMSMVKEAIECHLEGMLIDGEPIPKIVPIEKHQQNIEYKDGIWGIIEIDLSKLSVKSKRVNITIPENLLHTVDQYAKQHGETRSGLLTQAVTEYMTEHQGIRE